MSAGRILIVDDDPDIHATAGMALELAGFDVHHAYDGKNALKTLIAGNIPHVVLLDIQMPAMNGFELLNAMKAAPQLREIPVLILSSLDRPNLKVRAFQSGADDYIVKPFHPAELVARVTRAVQRTQAEGADETGLRGAFEHVPFEDLLQILESGGKDALVRLPKLGASLLIRGGNLIKAQWKQFEGEQAFGRMLLLSRGTFVVEPEDGPNGAGDEPGLGRVRDLLLDWTVRLDELATDLPSLRDATSMVHLAGDSSAVPLPEPLLKRMPLPMPVLVAELPATLEENVTSIAQMLASGLLEIHDHDEE